MNSSITTLGSLASPNGCRQNIVSTAAKGFVIGFGDDDAFARCKPIGLLSQLGRVVGPNRPAAESRVGKVAIGCGGGVCRRRRSLL